MGEPSQDQVAAALRRHYEIDVGSVAEVPGGEDSAAWVYRVQTSHAGRLYLAKVRRADGSRDVAAAVSRHLADQGLPHVVAPIRSKANSLTVEEGGLSVTVHPFVEGRTGVEAGLVERHWIALGELTRRLHATVLPPELSEQVPTETYRPAQLDVLRRVDGAVSAGDFGGRVAEEVAAFWTANRGEILALAERAAELGPRVERLSLPLVLCHADLHAWNILIDGDGELWLVDWDEVALAPKERDLMFVVGGIGAGLVEPHETTWFFEGYGDITVDPLALSYYRHAWAVQDIGGYGEQVFLVPSPGDEARSHAAGILIGLFEPGGIVELAR